VRLTSETIEDVIDLAASGEWTLDLRGVASIDAYALLVLDLVVRHARESRRPLRVAWPELPSVRRWMTAMRFFADIKTGLASRPAEGSVALDAQPTSESTVGTSERATGSFALGAVPPANGARALAAIASVEREDDVSRLVGAFDERLSDRFPIDEAPRRRFLRILLELFQNIPQHANAAGDVLDPHGIAAMQDDEAGVLLAVADKGIGLVRSLGLRDSPRLRSSTRRAALSDADALRAVVFDGRSRFSDPGRGHELERIFRLVRSWEGTMLVRSGTALLFQSDLGGDVVDVAPFPGVQIALFIPRAVFGLGEAAFGEGGVEPRGDPGFNEGNEEDDG
jgi:hypothetical protein